MKRPNIILFRITIVLSILAFLFFTLAPLNELGQGKVERAEKLSLFPLVFMDQLEIDLIRYVGTFDKFITAKAVVNSILSGLSWGLITWLAYVIGCSLLYPLFFWLIGKPIRTFTVPKLPVIWIISSMVFLMLWIVGLRISLEIVSVYLLLTAILGTLILIFIRWVRSQTSMKDKITRTRNIANL